MVTMSPFLKDSNKIILICESFVLIVFYDMGEGMHLWGSLIGKVLTGLHLIRASIRELSLFYGL